MKQTRNAQQNKQQRTFRVRSALQDNLLSLISIILLLIGTLAVVFLLLWLLYKAELISTPFDLFHREPVETEMLPSSIQTEYDFLRDAALASDPPDDDTIIRFSGSLNTLYTLLADEDPLREYYAEYETVLFSGTDELRYQIRIWKNGNAFRLTRQNTKDRTQEETYICDGTQILYIDTATEQSMRYPISDAFSMESLAGIPSVASFAQADDIIIDHAAYQEISGEIVCFVQFHHTAPAESPITEEYWISPERELVIRCRTYAGKTPVLTFHSTVRSSRALTAQEKQTLFWIDPDT